MKARDLRAPHKSGAGCLITASDTNRFMLIKRSEYVPVASTWSLPGGGIDGRERPDEAARREVLEEIGFDIGHRPMKLIYTNDVHAPRFRFYTYACLIDKEFEPTLNWESSEWIWCDIDNLPEPLHWGVAQLFTHDRAANTLKEFLDKQKQVDSTRS